MGFALIWHQEVLYEEEKHTAKKIEAFMHHSRSNLSWIGFLSPKVVASQSGVQCFFWVGIHKRLGKYTTGML